MRTLVLLLAFCSVAAAQSSADDPSAAVERLLAAGDSAAADRAVDAAIRQSPDDAALRRLRLALYLDGRGTSRLARWMRHEQIADAAKALLRRAPTDTLALRVLVDDAVWTAVNWHDRVELGQVRYDGRSEFVSQEEIRARLARSRFDTDARETMSPFLDRSQRARKAHEEAVELLATWFGQDAGAARAHEAAITLAVLTQNWDGALDLARRFQAVSDDPRADLYAGLALYRTGDAAGSEAAFDRAIEGLSVADRARYTDVRSLIPLDQRAAYDADPEAAARAFWTTADPRLLTEVNERVAEHRARVVEADLLFGWSGDDLFTLARPRGAETDQGQIWVRYGRPDRAIRYMIDTERGVPAYGGGRFTVYGSWDYPDFQFVFDDPERDGTFRTFSPPATAFGSPGTAMSARNDDFVMQDRELQRFDPQRTQDAPRRPLDVPALASRFLAPDGGTDVVVGWGVPLDSVAAPVRTGAFAVAGGAVRDRVVQDRQRLAPGRAVGGQWAEAATVRLPAAGTVRVEVEGDGGDAFGSAAFDLSPLAGGGGLGVSDLLLALSVDEDGQGPVVRRGVGLVPAPRAAFSTDDLVWVYLEAYGLTLGGGRSRYTVEATLRPEARRGGLLGRLFGRGQGPGVSVRTEAEGTQAVEAVTFFVDVGAQRPGRYTLRVEVRDEATGATASAERDVVLE